MNYNLNQQKAIDATDTNMIIKAPAGSGKTATIIGAIESYRKNNPQDKIVAITFTRKAAGELQDRIKLLNVEISTIHSWAYRRLQQLAAEYNFVVNLLEDDVIKEILKKLCKLRKQYYVNQFQLFSYVMGNYNIDIDDKVRKTFETILSDYIKFKRKNMLYDFTDLPQYLYDKLRDYDERIIDIDALFVDEFQDVDPVQLEIFGLVDAKKKVYIGDPLQSIYQFRGAVEEVFSDLEGFTEYNLDVNYRSYQEIVDYASTVNAAAREANEEGDIIEPTDIQYFEPSDIICERGKGGKVFVIDGIGSCNCITDYNDFKPYSDVLTVQSLITQSGTQVLCRSNKQVKKLQAQGIDNVSTIHQAKGLEYTNVILVNFPIDNDEERNIAYVGMTRAKNNLCVINFEVLLYIICNEQITTTRKLF